jgi:hypothetical protein
MKSRDWTSLYYHYYKSLKQEADQWYSDFIKLMEYSKNTKYGKTKCFNCLLSSDREEAAIFIGINKVKERTSNIWVVEIHINYLLKYFFYLGFSGITI